MARTSANPPPGLLFTAFEPSGDEHAAKVIAALRARHPDLPIHAWGGPRMQAAGATIIERTGDDAVMGVPGLAKIREHRRINQRVAAWLDSHPVRVLIPVDSPAANFPICRLAKDRGVRVVHLVAPQIWAWGRWRIHKLRRLTDLVLCLLPFEEVFFLRRDVPARFIGHVLFDEPLNEAALAEQAASFPSGSPRLAMMPGSRPDELRRNLPLLIDVFHEIRRRRPEAVGVIAATTPVVAEYLRERTLARLGAWPAGLDIVVGRTDAVINWCEVALVKSGTVTLQVARQGRPMVIFYKKSNPLLFLLARAVLSTKHYALPNVVANRRIVPEFVPHFGSARPIVDAAWGLITSPEEVARQQHDLRESLAPFRGRRAAQAAADAIEEIAGLREPALSPTPSPTPRAPLAPHAAG